MSSEDRTPRTEPQLSLIPPTRLPPTAVGAETPRRKEGRNGRRDGSDVA